MGTALPDQGFSTLLSLYMRRIRASASGVANEIGLSRETVNNWRNGTSRPSPRTQAKVLACARYLRLTEAETNRLLSSAGFKAEFPLQGNSLAQEEIPFAGFIDTLFQRLGEAAPYAITLLLSQAHWGQPPWRDTILARARQDYGQGAVLHVQPPYSISSAAEDYFGAIARQCGFDGVASDYEFEAALEARLLRDERVFCLVSRFEQGTPALRETLAGILRSLSEMHGGRLHLLLCGGAALADLKYRSGDLSLLNIARVEHWPELTLADLRLLARQRQLESAPDDSTLEMLLTLSGGHPALVEEGLQWLRQSPHPGAAIQQELSRHLSGNPSLWQAFLPLAGESGARERLQTRLRGEQLGRARPYLPDAELRHLFWSNLLCVRGQGEAAQLCWRSEVVRQAGLQVLESCPA